MTVPLVFVFFIDLQIMLFFAMFLPPGNSLGDRPVHFAVDNLTE